jgi:hypothetical protein
MNSNLRVCFVVFVFAVLRSTSLAEVFLPDCKSNVSIPPKYQISSTIYDGSFEEVSLSGNYTIYANAVTHYGNSFSYYGSPTAGVLTQLCVLEGKFSPSVPGLAALTLAGASEQLTLCLLLLFNSTDNSYTFSVRIRLWLQLDGFPACNADAKSLPTNNVISTAVKQPTPFSRVCPLTQIVPSELLQPLINTTDVLKEQGRLTVWCAKGFVPGAWAQVYFGAQYRMETCVLSVFELPADLSGLAGTTRLWQIIFGDGYTGESTVCGWWARIGQNLSYLVNWESVNSCPDSLAGRPFLTLPNYWNTSAAPAASATATPSPLPPPVSPASAARFHIGALGSPASIVVVVAIFVAALVAVAGAAYLIGICRRRILRKRIIAARHAKAEISSLDSQGVFSGATGSDADAVPLQPRSL